jgi:hypothetical protein
MFIAIASCVLPPDLHKKTRRKNTEKNERWADFGDLEISQEHHKIINFSKFFAFG